MSDAASFVPALQALPDQVHGPGDPLRAIRAALSDLDRQRAELAAAGDVTALAGGLVAFRRIIADLRLIDQLIETDLAGLIPDRGPHVIEGVGVVQVRQSASTSWDGPGLLRRLSSSLVDPVTGEVVDAVRRDVLEQVLPQHSSPSAPWRVNGLRHVGVAVDEFRDQKFGRKTVQITAPEE